MAVFADSSALVKLYVLEPGATGVRDLAELYVSLIARVEVPSALWRKVRENAHDRALGAELVRAFEDDWSDERFAIVGMTDTIVEQAARLCGTQGLRAYDAVQLASALAARNADPECSWFACFDQRLRQAAAQEGFPLLPMGMPDYRAADGPEEPGEGHR